MSDIVTSSGFANQKITFLNKITTQDMRDFSIKTEWVEGKTYQSCVYSKTLSSNYFGTGLWKESTLYIAMIDYTTDDLPLESRVRFNGVDYGIDYIDDVAFQHEAIFIGLKALQ